MIRALIDTDILSYYFKGNRLVIDNFKEYLKYFDYFEISVITYYEIVGGLLAKDAHRQLNIFEEFVSDNIVLQLNEGAAKVSGELYSTLRKSGNIIDDIDLLIAGIAIDNDLVLVTNNESHFMRIPGLRIENWAKKRV